MIAIVHGVSPRDRWMCVLPGWQMNVNVNVMFAIDEGRYGVAPRRDERKASACVTPSSVVVI